MFGIGLPEIALIAVVATLFLGPDKLPGLARQAGAVLRQAKRFADSARDELREGLGPDYADLELRDLDPRSLVRRHLLEAMADEDDDDDEDEDDVGDEANVSRPTGPPEPSRPPR